MIQANECRVNNRYIRELKSDRGLEYDNDFILTEEWMGKLFGDDTSIALQDLFPLPITVDLLKDYRFRLKKMAGVYSNPKDCIIDLSFTYVGIYSERLEDDIKFDLPKAFHLLQNIYHFITGKELQKNKSKCIKKFQSKKNCHRWANL